MVHINKFLKNSFLIIFGIVSLTSCNKDLEQFPDNPSPSTNGLSISETLTATPTDSLFNRLVIKGGMAATLNNKALGYTLFVPSNTAIIASFGGTLALANARIAAISAAQAAAIVKYHMVPGYLPTSRIVHGFPNMQMPTDIILDPTNPLVRMTSFPSKNPSTGLFYYNNVPFTGQDFQVDNSVIHHIAFVAGPPSRVLKDTIGRVSNLAYFRAAVARADSGQTGLNRFDSLLNYAVTNMTVLAPNDAAFQTLIFGMVYGQTLQATGNPTIATQQANAAVALGPAIFSVPAFYGALPASTVRGIIAYHLLASPNVAGAIQPNIRVFSVNIPTTPNFFIKTLVNASVAAHPGVKAEVVFTGPVASSLRFTGLGTFPPGGPAYSQPANVVSMDQPAVNGVFHIIDRVLLPQ